jgi:DNA primase
MAGRVRQEDLEAVRERSDIVQVISGYLQLKKAGRDSLVGLCPFHTEKTPSLSVSPSKQVYYCFGCGEAGNVFRFLMKMESLSFGEAVETLAKTAGVTLQYEGQTAAGRRSEGRREAIYRAISEAGALYQHMLREGREAAEARGYLASRGITTESVERFGLGYAPGYSDFLLKRLSRTYSPELLLEAGLASRGPSGDVRDQFRGRVMFPIHDVAGHAVGFGGRLLPGDKAPAKYMNSPDVPVYRKSTLLYNLNRGKADITRSERSFVVEGYTDVIALDQGGVRNSVATCGTAFGVDHVRQLARFTNRLVLAFDSDDAGARAAERAFQFHQHYPVQLSVLVLPEGQDPADFALANGGEAFLELADRAIPLVAYMLDRLVRGRDLRDIEQRALAVREGLAIVAELEDPVSREEYAGRLAGLVGESENSVMLELERALARQASPSTAPERAHRARVPPEEEVEWEVLKLLVQAPELCSPWVSGLNTDRFGKATHRKAFEAILEAGVNGDAGPVSMLVAGAHERWGEQVGRLLAAAAVERPKSDGDPTLEYAEQLFLRLEEFSLKRKADVIRKELERVNPLKAPAAHESLFEQLIELEGARRRLRPA